MEWLILSCSLLTYICIKGRQEYLYIKRDEVAKELCVLIPQLTLNHHEKIPQLYIPPLTTNIVIYVPFKYKGRKILCDNPYKSSTGRWIFNMPGFTIV